ncbi:hypothetical protein NA57DRAFT_81275 [Rhizodiscina lignyota]|uniref:Methionyl-tRNA formyltransferase n=1 Tax=Rhizodiscina lignyota TaxID=1504668 RepID=A0A9P4I606_9PEZI|nr:hypothetical protein NA57DRAFT_81275 [Rhizodiscina lignyota]
MANRATSQEKMTTKANAKNTIIFCCLLSHEIVSFLIETLRKRSYHVSLLVTCPMAFNYAMNTNAIMDMGKTIGEVVDKVFDPPPILSVTSTRQVEKIYAALDPDLALSYFFAYPISKKMLAQRAPIVNLHPGKLPKERGPFPGLWPALQPEKYTMDDFAATFHYMSEGVDCGPIIKEIPLKHSYPARTTVATRLTGLFEVANNAFFAHLDEVLELVEKGYKGVAQPPVAAGAPAGYGARSLTDEERTIKTDMTKDEVLHLLKGIVETEGLTPALFWWQGRRYTVERAAEWSPFPGCKEGDTVEVGTVKRVGFALVVKFEGGALRFAVRTR